MVLLFAQIFPPAPSHIEPLPGPPLWESALFERLSNPRKHWPEARPKAAEVRLQPNLVSRQAIPDCPDS